MSVTVAKNAGFCFGVKRATDSLEAAMAAGEGRVRIYTLGNVIHNDTYNGWLRENGVRVTSIAEVPSLAESSAESSPVKVFVRAHGIPAEDEAVLVSLALNICLLHA